MYDAVLAPGGLEPRRVGPLDCVWQPGLLTELVGIDHSFASSHRRQLDDSSWVDHAAGWLAGSDEVFETLLDSAAWTARTVVMYHSVLPEPRLTARWECGSEPGVLAEIRVALCARYGIAFDSVGVNLYRDGRDSVAWHRDRVHRRMVEPVVATITLGAPRRFLLRPFGGGRSLAITPHAGDLLVMGGRCQQDWEHTVPKCSDSGPRMAITVRHSG